MIILDTNVLSELVRPHPSAAVTDWLANQLEDELVITTITVAELFYGLELMPHGARRTQLAEVLNHLLTPFLDRLLPFDAVSALRYGTVKAGRDRQGRPISVQDAMIAAIALSCNASVATRNVKDFAHTGVPLLNPWEVVPDERRLNDPRAARNGTVGLWSLTCDACGFTEPHTARNGTVARIRHTPDEPSRRPDRSDSDDGRRSI